MKLKHYIFALAAITAFSLSSCNKDDKNEPIPEEEPEEKPDDKDDKDDEKEDEKDDEGETSTAAIEFLQAAKIGWNLGNQLDAHVNGVSNETSWGNVAATQTLIDSVAKAGFGIIRIPTTWLGHIGEKPNYTIDSKWMARVTEVVNYAKNANIKAIVNIHHDGYNSEQWLNIKKASQSATNRAAIKDQLYKMWFQIATNFKDYGDFLIFEGMNEIQDGGWGWGGNRTDNGLQYSILNEWNQTFVDAVRAAGGENANRYLGICGYSTNPDLTLNYMTLPTDVATNKLLVTVHYYDPYEFAIEAKYNQWGHYATNTTTYGQEADVKSTFAKLKAKYIDKGVPIYLGEYGAIRQSGAEKYRNYYMEYITKAANTYGIVPIYWDNGSTGSGKECFGIFNRSNGKYQTYCGEMLPLMMKAANVTASDESYTLQSVYDKPLK